jgi:fatty acid desaturase
MKNMFASDIVRLKKARYWSAPRLLLDVAAWTAAAAIAVKAERAWITVLVVAFIGAIPMHDILFHAHEGAHRRIARTRWLNELLTWLTHAAFGLSGAGYRHFHLAHHRYAHTERDPEMILMDRVISGAPGLAWLAMPFAAYASVNVWPFRKDQPLRLRKRVARDLLFAALLHCALVFMLGLRVYALFLIAPALTSLSVVVVIRSICEHHGKATGDTWTNTRTMKVSPVLDFLWSNANYHLEHHLFPSVPFHKLPEVRRLLEPEYAARGILPEKGYATTALRLLRERRHFAEKAGTMEPAKEKGDSAVDAPLIDTTALPFRVKKYLFRDILRCPVARRHLWSVYFTGEAYEELHADAVYIDKLPPRLGRLLAKHLADETRHAAVFRSFLAADASDPVRVAPLEDVGWTCLTSSVPDVVAKARTQAPFSNTEAARYMAFLHALELRSLSDLFALIEAARSLGENDLADAILRITKDERFHATYTHHAVFELAQDRAAARSIIDDVRGRERKAYARCMSALLSHFAALGATPAGFGDRARWFATKLLVRTGLAFPLLPILDRVPRRLTA